MNDSLELIAELIGDGSSYCQIARALKLAFDSGKIPPGTRLPSARELAVRVGVSRSTAHRSLQTLSSQGYIRSAVGKASQVQSPFITTVRSTAGQLGSFDCSPLPEKEIRFSLLDSYAGRELDLIEGSTINRIRMVFSEFSRSSNNHDQQLLGNPLLRQAMSDYLLRARLVRSTRYDIAVLSGPSTRLELIVALLVKSGDEIAVPRDANEKLIRLLNFHGARTIIVECDSEGMQVDRLPIGAEAPRMVYVTPSRGAVLSMNRRKQLSDWVRDNRSIIVEDDCQSFRTSGTDCLPAVHSFQTEGRVLYLPSPSTILSPLLKVCCAVLPGSMMQAFLRLKSFVDPRPSEIEQSILCDLLTSGHLESMLAKERAGASVSIADGTRWQRSSMPSGEIELETSASSSRPDSNCNRSTIDAAPPVLDVCALRS